MTEQRKDLKRRYTLRRRRERQDVTRQRIVEAAFGLHATVGPSRTSISAIAERAGVQRHTVYNHFPDLDSLYEACTAHGMRASGIPTGSDWAQIADPDVRLDRGLRDLYTYYRSNESMLRTILGDTAPDARPPAEPDLFEKHMAELHATLAFGSEARSPRIFEAALSHAMRFDTWASLTEAGLSDDEVRALMLDIVRRVRVGSLTT